jgi:N-acetylmuramoyl-L-alanine amidase
LRPPIVSRLIPFDGKRRAETVAYAQRHYGLDTWRLRHPRVIVEHYSVTQTLQAAWNAFAPDRPDVELHELPGICAHFIVDTDGAIYQLVRLSTICRHTVGLNYTAIGIEHVGMTQAEVLGNAVQMRASVRLTRWLRCRYGIRIADVIGHNESLASPYHHEKVAALARQTHADWPTSAMRVYRRLLKQSGC